eukprot:CAMPEP_0171927942 /NCGR_PEP_ID=MMETSP0993-20121228/26308_1 /TAXON_ID=483369 /ORGANISM="non described non described, Strain CCMP2098" /LENGTH=37 /DNA_ID= /DNA_START= /DNA_END= /DNA_ORIENTATION=
MAPRPDPRSVRRASATNTATRDTIIIATTETVFVAVA